MNKKILSSDKGMKIIIYEVRPVSPEGLKRIKNLRRKNLAYIPLKPILMIPPHFKKQQEIVELIYNTFGASEEETTYAVSYWRKVNRWSRRLKRLFVFKVWDKPDGDYRYKIIDFGMLGRYGYN